MQDIASASLTKERILQHIRNKGPSLPVHVARAVNLSQLFASAFLSELYREGKIKISNIRVGSSPLYYIEGQEQLLENFIEHLNQKEREAFTLIKENKFLFDDELQPAIRVAIRSLKDFALPIKRDFNGEARTIWKYFLAHESEIPTPRPILKPETIQIVKEIQEIQNKSEIEKTAPTIQEKPEQTTIEKIKENLEEIKEKTEEHPVKEKKQKVKKTSNSDLKFLENIKDYIKNKNIDLIEVLSDKKKDFAAKIMINMPFGKQEFLLIFKDKKKLNEDDLTLALHKAQQEKMPALIYTPGEVDKKAHDYLNIWRNLIKVEKVKF